jgi:tryptophan synthase beta chain
MHICLKAAVVFFLSATDDEALHAAFHVAKTEGIIPALESAHAFSVLGKLNLKSTDRVVVCLSGRGDKDLATYMNAMEK